MNEVFVGELIRKRRKELHLTQEELSNGICEASTLSRIENKRQTPTRNVLNALLARLGLSDERFYAAVTSEELKINKLFIEITNYNVEYEKTSKEEREVVKLKLLKKHAELQKIMDEDDNVSKQFLIRSQVIISDWSIEDKIKKLIEAMRLTKPNFELEEVKSGIFTFDEIKIIHLIAVSYAEGNNSEMAIEIWRKLLHNIEHRFEEISPARAQKDLILFGLARELLIIKNYECAWKYAEEGRELAVHCTIYQHLPGFIIILGECEYQFGNLNKSEYLFKQAYYLCESIGDKANRKLIYDGYLDYFGKEIS